MSIDFDVLKGILSIDAKKWDKGLADAQRSLGNFRKSVDGVFSSIDTAAGRLSSATNRITQSAAGIDRMVQVMDRSRGSIRAVGSDIGGLGGPLAQAANYTRAMTTQSQGLNRELAQMRANTQFAQPMVQQTRLVVQSSQQAEAAITRLSNAARGLGASLQAGMQRATETIRGVSTVASTAAAVGAADSTRLAATFEQGMSRVKALVSGRVTDTQELERVMKDMEALAQKLGAETVYTARDAAGGMEELARAGVKASDIMKAMPAVLDLAAAGNVSVSDSAKITAQALYGLEVPADKMGHLMDVLAKAATTAKTDILGIGEGLKYVGPIATMSGMSMERLIALMQAMQNKGLDGSTAGTGLRSLMTDVARLDKTTKKFFDDMGVETRKPSGAMRDLLDIIKDIDASMKRQGMSSEQMITKASAAMDVRSATALAALSSTGGEAIGKMEEALKAADGTASRIAKTMLDNLIGSFTKLDNATEGLRLRFGQGLTPALRSGVDAMTAWIDKNQQWLGQGIDSAVDRLVRGGTEAVRVIGMLVDKFSGPLVSGVSGLFALFDKLPPSVQGLLSLGAAMSAVSLALRAIGPMTPIIGGLLTIIGNLVNPFSMLSTAASMFATATTAVGGSIGTVLTIVNPYTVAIGAIALAIRQAMQSSDEYAARGKFVWDNVVQWATKAKSAFMDLFGNVGAGLSKWASENADSLQRIVEKLGELAINIGVVITNIVNLVSQSDAWGKFGSAGEWAIGVIKSAFESLMFVIETGLDALNGDFRRLETIGLGLKKIYHDALATFHDAMAEAKRAIGDEAGANLSNKRATQERAKGQAALREQDKMAESIVADNEKRKADREGAAEMRRSRERFEREEREDKAKEAKAAAKNKAAPEAQAGGAASIPAERVNEPIAEAKRGLPGDHGKYLDGDWSSMSRNQIQENVGNFNRMSMGTIDALRRRKGREEAGGGTSSVEGKDLAEMDRLRQQIIQTMQAAKQASGEARGEMVASLGELESKYAATYQKISDKIAGTYKAETEQAKTAGDAKVNTAKATADKEIAESDRRVQADKKGREQEVSNAKSAAIEKQAASQSVGAGGSGASMVNGSVTYAGGRKLTNQGNGISLSAGGTGNGAPIYTDQVGSAMTQIMQMSFGLTNLFNGAVQGIGAGMASFNQALEEASPMQRLDMMIGNLQAKAGMMMHNTAVTGSMESRRAEVNVQEELDLLQRQKNKLWWEEADARSKAEDRARAAKNKPAAAPIGGNRGSQAGQYGAMSVHDSGSTTVVQNFNGVTDHAEFAKQLEGALDRRGTARSNTRNRFFSRSDSTFAKQGG